MARAWMPMYWGDYLRDTASLSAVEHGIYVKLLGTYYSTGEPLPANARRLLTICCATTDDEKEAVTTILQMYFHLDGDVYRNKRADREIAKSLEVSAKRAAAGHAGAKATNTANGKAKGAANKRHLPTQLQPQLHKKEKEDAPAIAVAGLDTNAWMRWETYRREIRKPIKPASMLAAQQKLAGFGADQSAVVEHSIANGYQGLFPVGGKNETNRKLSAVERVAANIKQRHPDAQC